MDSLWKKITLKTLRNNVLAGVAVLVLTFILMFLMMGDYVKYLFPARDFQSLNPYQLNTTDAYYRCNTNSLIDWFAYNDSGYLYVVQIEDEGELNYMGFFVPHAYREKAEKICDEVYDFYDGGPVPKTTLRGRGFVCDMTEEERDLFDGFFANFDYDYSSLLEYKIFVYVPIKSTLNFEVVGYGIIILLMYCVSLAFFVNAAFGFSNKSIRDYMKRRNLSINDFNEEMNGCVVFGKERFYCGSKFLVYLHMTAKVFDYEDIVMVQPHVMRTKHYIYFVPAGTTETYSLMITTKDGKNQKCDTATFEEAVELCKYICEMNPVVVSSAK